MTDGTGLPPACLLLPDQGYEVPSSGVVFYAAIDICGAAAFTSAST